MKLSALAAKLYGQPMFSLLDKANEIQKTRKVIHYEIGDPGFDTPENIVKDTVKALTDGKTHYVSSKGLDECREAVREYFAEHYTFRPDRNQVVICMANAAIDFVCRLTVEPGEEIIYPDPGFSTYFSVITYNGFLGAPVSLTPSNGYVMKADEIEKKITPKTRLIIMNSGHNPTGSLMTEQEVYDVYRLAQKHDLFILSDEVYARILYEGKYFSPSAYDECKERVIVIGSMSKTYAMTGWRQGYVVCPEYLADKLALLIQTVLSCMPNFLQYGMAEGLTGDQKQVESRIEILRERRDHLVGGLNLLQGVTCEMPKAAFYAFPYIGRICKDDIWYCGKLLEYTGICTVPGSYFGAGGKEHIRLCYAGVDINEIEESLHLIRDFNEKIMERKMQ